MPLAHGLRTFGCVVALVAAGCEKTDDAPEPEVSYSASADSLDAEPVSGSGFLDPNLATAAALTALPGMSDSVTLAVIAGRPYSRLARRRSPASSGT